MGALGKKMPISPKFKVETVPYCNLRQAVQWIRDGIPPVERVYEAPLGISAELQSDFAQAKSKLWLAISAEKISLLGRPSIGALKFDIDKLFCYYAWFEQYGERERVPIERFHDAGFEIFNVQRSWVGKVTGVDEQHWPNRGWVYSDLIVSTSELMQVFPEEMPLNTPLVIELRSSERQASAIPLLPEPSILTLEAPAPGHPFEEDPRLAKKSQDCQPAVESSASVESEYCEPGSSSPCDANLLPAYLQFLVELVPLLGGRENIVACKKADIQVEIEARWRPELGQRSQNLVGAMATILRPPEAQRGGAKPMRAGGNSTMREGWNGSILANEAATEIEAVSDETV